MMKMVISIFLLSVTQLGLLAQGDNQNTDYQPSQCATGFYEEIKKQIKEELYEEIKAQVRKELLSEEMNKRWFDLATVYFKDIDFFDRPNANGEFGYIGMTSFIDKVALSANSWIGPYDRVDYNKIEREFLKKAKGLNFRMP